MHYKPLWILVAFACGLWCVPPARGADVRLLPEPPGFVIELPTVVLTDVPVSSVRITAQNVDGKPDTAFNGRPLIEGLRLSVREPGRDGKPAAAIRNDAELPPFVNGTLELTTDLAAGRKVYVTGNEIVVDPQGARPGRIEVSRTLRWFAIVPPLLAIVLAIWLKNIFIALFAGVWSGAVILSRDFFDGFLRTLDTYLLGELVKVDGGKADTAHMTIILFTMFLGAMVGVMSRSGGTLALVQKLAHVTQTRERGQLLAWALGLVVFFDDYANTLLVGSTMRPVADRLKFSRAKLAFLVDSTAAPVAGLAIISTWVGVELSYISDTYAKLGLSADVYDTFLYTIAYRFYPLHLLVFVWLIAYLGHDYGPMLRAESRAWQADGATIVDSTAASTPHDELDGELASRKLAVNALVPVGALLLLILIGLWTTGAAGLREANAEAAAAGGAAEPLSLHAILGHSDSNRVLFLSSFVASLVAVFSSALTRSLSLSQAMDAWIAGVKSMLIAVVVLVLAWGIATLCDGEHLNTAGLVIELTAGRVPVNWIPLLAFVLAAIVSFATGSSWATMGLLMPLFISVTYYGLVEANDVGLAAENHPIMLASIGAILGGAIFGDHCSPISDTTILSSAASGCDHLEHVSTQLPYALTVGAISIVLGYLPVAFGYRPVILLPLGLVVMFLLVQFLGRPVEKLAAATTPDDPPRAVIPNADRAADV